MLTLSATPRINPGACKSPEADQAQSGRLGTVRRFGYDVKFGYHVVRLLNQVEQILTESDMDIEQNREQLKAIRRGDWLAEFLQKKGFGNV